MNFESDRVWYLTSFPARDAWRTTLYVHDDVPSDAVHEVANGLERAHDSATRQLGLAAEPPLLFLYPSVDVLREWSCASPLAVAYYDGAIHLAAVPNSSELLKSLTHEYVHHVLISNDIRGPIWFHEGAAMAIARDSPAGHWSIWRQKPLDLERMIHRFPKTARLEEAVTFYAQAYVMTDFLDRLCLTRPGCGLAELADALVNGRATSETLFSWAVATRGSDLSPTARVSLWDDYGDYGNFPPATYAALLSRAGLRPGGH